MSVQFITGEVVNDTTPLGSANLSAANFENVLAPLADGAPDPGFTGVVEAGSMMDIELYDIEQAATFAAWGGTALSGNGVIAYFRNLPDSAVRAAAGSYKATIATGTALPRYLRAAQGSLAAFGVSVIGHNTGGTVPMVIESTSTALTSPTQGVAFTLGPCYLNGSLLSGVTAVNLDFGIQGQEERCDGKVYPSSYGIESRRPSVMIETLNAATAAVIGSGGFAVTQFDFYLQQVTLGGGGVVAAASTVHFKVAINVGNASNLVMGGRRLANGFRLTPFVASGTAAIIMTADQALP